MSIGQINSLPKREMKNSENIKGGAGVERGIFFGKLPVILCNNVGSLEKNVGTLGKNVGFLGCEKLHLGDYSINCNLSKTLIINYIYIYKYLN